MRLTIYGTSVLRYNKNAIVNITWCVQVEIALSTLINKRRSKIENFLYTILFVYVNYFLWQYGLILRYMVAWKCGHLICQPIYSYHCMICFHLCIILVAKKCTTYINGRPKIISKHIINKLWTIPSMHIIWKFFHQIAKLKLLWKMILCILLKDYDYKYVG